MESAPPTTTGVRVRPLKWSRGSGVFDAFFPVTFEQAAAQMARLPRLDVEPDGFFVQSGAEQQLAWRLSGQLFDFDDRLHRVELNGSCPAAELKVLLSCFGLDPQQLVFELAEQGLLLDAHDFLGWAASSSHGT